MSLRGYCRTFNVFIACNPAMRMTKLTTIASTGRLMKRSVNDVIYKFGIRASDFLSIWRFRIQFWFGCKIVVHGHSHSVAQLKESGAHKGLACFQSLRNRDEIATCFTDPRKLLPKHLRFLARLRVLLFLDHKNRIAVWRIRH